MAHIAVVDDSGTILMSVSQILEKEGHTVQTYSNAEEALKGLNGSSAPDVVITDLNMPGKDGIQLIREARQIRSLRFTPILMLTTESQQEKRDEAKKAGATGWLVKPVNAQDLVGTLNQVLGGR